MTVFHAISRKRGPAILIAAMLALGGCGERGDAPDSPAPDSLEAAALDAGVIVDAQQLDPVGAYMRNHENGRNELCIGNPRVTGRRFGMIADLGEGLLCQGRGSVKIDGEAVRFTFDGPEACSIAGQYDGQAIRLDGEVPRGCAAYCSARATFAGLSVLRSGWSGEDARGVVARIGARGADKGESLCP